jgi:hypothetical protein
MNSKSQQEILEFCFFNCQITVCGLKKINVKRKKSDVLDAKHAKSQEKQLSINDLLKPTPKCIEINNGVVYEIRKNSASDEIATKTLAELGKDNEEFKKTNSESLRKKVQYVYNKIKLLKRKGNADVLDKYAKSTFSPPVYVYGVCQGCKWDFFQKQT